MDEFEQDIKEEIINSISHGIGFVLSILAFVVLLYFSIQYGNAKVIASAIVYGSSLLLMYLFSTLYHSIQNRKAKTVLRRLDHISIYLLIAGTYTPIALISLNSMLGWVLFWVEASFAFIGITFKAIFGPKLSIISSIFYLLMGWVAMIAIKPMVMAISIKGFLWIILGGAFYSLGVIFFAMDKRVKYFHAIWHLFVILGSLYHFIAILKFVILK